jgi:hypothetical protein
VRKGCSYFISKADVLRVHSCGESVGLGEGVGLASLEGLPALVVEPERMLSPATVAQHADAPALALIVAQSGPLMVAIAADAVSFVSAADASSPSLRREQIQAFMAASL